MPRRRTTTGPAGDAQRRPRVRRPLVRRLRWIVAVLVVVSGLVAWQAWRMLGAPSESAEPVAGVPLRLHEPAEGAARQTTTVIFLSSDAGWVGVNQRLPEALAAAGYPTYAWNSLRYYLRRRTPEEAADDLMRVLDEAGRRFGTARFALVGYSWGAGVLPFLANRLPAEQRVRLEAAVYLSYPGFGGFEFYPSAWWLQTHDDLLDATPEVARLGDVPSLCIAGREDPIRDCSALLDLGVERELLPVGHSFDGLSSELLPRIRALLEASNGDEVQPAASPAEQVGAANDSAQEVRSG